MRLTLGLVALVSFVMLPNAFASAGDITTRGGTRQCIQSRSVVTPISAGAVLSDFQEYAVSLPTPYVRTAQVNWAMKPHDEGPHLCCVAAPAPRLWKQSSILFTKDSREYSEWQCYATFSEFQEVMPGIYEPRKACFTAFVKSDTTPGHRGELWCRFSGVQIDPTKPH